MRIRYRKFFIVVVAITFASLLFGCGKQEKSFPVSRSLVSVNYTYTENGFFCLDNESRRLEYFDYEMQSYFPVCSRPNCKHDTEECTAVSLERKAICVGQLGEKLYYLQLKDMEEGAFYSCDPDGGNVQEAASFSKMPNNNYGTMILFQDHQCILAAGHDLFDEETFEPLGVTSAIYSVNLKNGDVVELLPERLENCPSYIFYGLYEEKLLFSEWNGEAFFLKVLDLKTKEISMPFGEISVSGRCKLEAEYFLGNIKEGDGWKVKEFNLKTGEVIEIAAMELLDAYWKDEMKILIDSDNQTWQYEEGNLQLIREGKENRLVPIGGRGELLVGSRNYRDLVYIKKDDFLAGKNTWTVVKGTDGH